MNRSLCLKAHNDFGCFCFSIFAWSHIDLVVSIFRKIYPIQIISNYIKANTFVEYDHLPQGIPRTSWPVVSCHWSLVDQPQHMSFSNLFDTQKFSLLKMSGETVISNCFYADRNVSNKPETAGGSEKYTYIHQFTHRCMYVVICVCVCVPYIYVRAYLLHACFTGNNRGNYIILKQYFDLQPFINIPVLALTRWFLWVITLRFASYFCIVLCCTTEQCLIFMSLQDEHGFHGFLIPYLLRLLVLSKIN